MNKEIAHGTSTYAEELLGNRSRAQYNEIVPNTLPLHKRPLLPPAKVDISLLLNPLSPSYSERIEGSVNQDMNKIRDSSVLIQEETASKDAQTLSKGLQSSSEGQKPPIPVFSDSPRTGDYFSPQMLPRGQQTDFGMTKDPFDHEASRTRGNLPKAVTDPLRVWLHEHIDHPFPSEEDKRVLATGTGLSSTQVQISTTQ